MQQSDLLFMNHFVFLDKQYMIKTLLAEIVLINRKGFMLICFIELEFSHQNNVLFGITFEYVTYQISM